VAGERSYRGSGAGSGLGSQGALALSEDGRWIFAVNAGSNDVSVFRVNGRGLSLASRSPSGGIRPVSLTVHDDVLYVLNAGGDGNISASAWGLMVRCRPLLDRRGRFQGARSDQRRSRSAPMDAGSS